MRAGADDLRCRTQPPKKDKKAIMRNYRTAYEFLPLDPLGSN